MVPTPGGMYPQDNQQQQQHPLFFGNSRFHPPRMSTLIADEPLDLSVDNNEAPLDLSVNKSAANIRDGKDGGNNKRDNIMSQSNLIAAPMHYPVHTQFFSGRSGAIVGNYPVEMASFDKHQPLVRSSILQSMGQHLEKLHCVSCAFQCDLSYTESFYLHLGNHTGREDTFNCFHCGKPFHHKRYITEHILTHEKLNHFVCSICFLAFNSGESLLGHCRRRHSAVESSMILSSYPFLTHRPGIDLQNVPPTGIATLVHTPRLLPNVESSNSPATQTFTIPVKNGVKHSPESKSQHKALPKKTDAVKVESQSGSTTKRVNPPTLADYISNDLTEALSKHINSGQTPSLTDILFMQSPEGCSTQDKEPLSDGSVGKTPQKNLRNLMEELVEQRIYAGQLGKPLKKADLNFIVTFSDDDNDDEGADEEESAAKRSAGGENLRDENSLDVQTMDLQFSTEASSDSSTEAIVDSNSKAIADSNMETSADSNTEAIPNFNTESIASSSTETRAKSDTENSAADGESSPSTSIDN